MSGSVTNIRDALLAELEQLGPAYEEQKAKVAMMEQTMKQLEAALKVLQPGRVGRGKASRGDARPCARKSDVHEVCKALVLQNGSILKADLEELAKEKLSMELGFSLSGFGLRFKEVLASPSFDCDESDNVSIAKGGAQDSQPRVSIRA
jgi:hypothetical protein